MDTHEIDLKAIKELLKDESGNSLNFFIPAYQRGYRWSPFQVLQLLWDIREFTMRNNPQPEDFYCLQPLVCKAYKDYFEVVDGQQRLTTLFLILQHFNDRLAKKYKQTIFTLNYETRPELKEKIADLDEDSAKDNVDFFHIYKAKQAIEKWFEDHDSEVEGIKSALLNSVKVIWFQLADSDDPVDAFTRLNVGKIPLTSDELIRALFLRSSSSGERDTVGIQLQIAHDWDQMEKGLQSSAFWGFLSNGNGENKTVLVYF